MAKFSHLYDIGTKTEGEGYDTGLRLRGFEVWAQPPHHYRHYTTLFVMLPDVFATEAHQDGEWLGGKPRWTVAFRRPDGKWKITYCSYDTREQAEHARNTYRNAKTARLGCQFEVGYKIGEVWSDKEHGRPWGTTWADPAYDYAPLKFDLTVEEAAAVLEFREEMDAVWQDRQAAWIAREKRHDEAVARAVALDALPQSVIHAIAGPTECLECGAVFEEPGHVEAGGMTCDRCG
jgi:hypothetical protein